MISLIRTESYIYHHPPNSFGGVTIITYILIITVPRREREVINALKRIPELIEVIPLFGEYDVIVKIKAENLDIIGDIVMRKIRRIPGVLTTKTLPGIKL